MYKYSFIQEEAGDSSDGLTKRRVLLNSFPEFIGALPESWKDEDILELKEVKDYVETWDKFRNEGETLTSVREYGEAAKKLLGITSLEQSDSSSL